MRQLAYALLALFFYSVDTSGQIKLPTNESGLVQYQEIVRVPDSKRPAKKLMEQARAWADQYYKSSQGTEQMFDQEHNILFVKSNYLIDNNTIRYTLTIEPKYGRYRATLTDLIAESNGMNSPVQATSATVADISRVVADSLKKQGVVEQTAQQQEALYRELNQWCRDTLASLKEAMSEGESN